MFNYLLREIVGKKKERKKEGREGRQEGRNREREGKKMVKLCRAFMWVRKLQSLYSWAGYGQRGLCGRAHVGHLSGISGGSNA